MVKGKLVLCALIAVIFNDLRKDSFSISPVSIATNQVVNTNMLLRSGNSGFNNHFNYLKQELGVQYSKEFLKHDSKYWSNMPFNDKDLLYSAIIGVPVSYDGNKLELK
ncbi:MAG: hypothetical protein WC755_06420 [Candidatus Woesearchaeota archaeon]|jgi:hypothetical protein